MVPDKYNMIDLEGIDIIYSQGVVVDGLYNKLLSSMSSCKYAVVYNWLFDGVNIPPTFVELSIEPGIIYINSGISVGSNDTIHINTLEPVIERLEVSENGTYTKSEGGYNPVVVDVPNTYTESDEGKVVYDGELIVQIPKIPDITQNGTYDTTLNNSVTVDVPSSSALSWRDNFAVNWDFSNPVNTRGQPSYSKSTGGFTIDGWYLQDAVLNFVQGGIKLSRLNANTAGYFLQVFGPTATSAMVGQQFTLTLIVDGVLATRTITIPSVNSGTPGYTANGVRFRVWNYSSGRFAITIDIAADTGTHVIQAVKLEAGSTQTLATQIGGVWTLNNSMDADTEFFKARTGTVLNSGSW